MVQAYLYIVSRGNESNSLVVAAKALADCCLSCLQRFLEFVNKNAYIQTAIEGTNFCTSASNAFQLLLRNALRLAAITGITTVFLCIGKLFVAAVTGFISALIIMGGDINDVVNAPMFSVTVIVLMAFAIGSAFMDSWVGPCPRATSHARSRLVPLHFALQPTPASPRSVSLSFSHSLCLSLPPSPFFSLSLFAPLCILPSSSISFWLVLISDTDSPCCRKSSSIPSSNGGLKKREGRMGRWGGKGRRSRQRASSERVTSES